MNYLNPHTTGTVDASEAINAWLNREHVTDPDVERTDRTALVLYEVSRERGRQDEKFGEQNHPDGTGTGGGFALVNGLPWDFAALASRAKHHAAYRAELGTLTWADVLLEEVFEALAEDDPVKLRAELVQVAAVAVAHIEAIDRRRP